MGMFSNKVYGWVEWGRQKNHFSVGTTMPRMITF